MSYSQDIAAGYAEQADAYAETAAELTADIILQHLRIVGEMLDDADAEELELPSWAEELHGVLSECGIETANQRRWRERTASSAAVVTFQERPL